MFKNITMEPFTTIVIIEKDKQQIALFRGEYILGQINSDLIKSCTTSYDADKRIKTIVLEV